jgi:hypothetical protein
MTTTTAPTCARLWGQDLQHDRKYLGRFGPTKDVHGQFKIQRRKLKSH